jgi:multiple sugar transport system ATP-binding protein
MDEPLSNLDAKLRVGMRASLAQLHGRLGVTTVYVTHDQTEAMTLGQRVAVMRDGRIVQVDTPQRLYRDPVDLYVAGFIGTPAMNLVEAQVDGGDVVFGSRRLPLDPSRRPPPGTRELVLGIRPEEFEDAAFAPARLPALEATVTVLEDLGADAHVFFNVDARPAGATRAADADTSILADEGTLFTARVDPRTTARVGERVRLAVDPARFHFFDPETGRSLVGPAAAEQPAPELAPAAG